MMSPRGQERSMSGIFISYRRGDTGLVVHRRRVEPPPARRSERLGAARGRRGSGAGHPGHSLLVDGAPLPVAGELPPLLAVPGASHPASSLLRLALVACAGGFLAYLGLLLFVWTRCSEASTPPSPSTRGR